MGFDMVIELIPCMTVHIQLPLDLTAN